MNSTTERVNNPNILMCVLSYLGLLSLIPYFVKKDDAFVHWHAKQGIVITAFSILVYFALYILMMVPGIAIVAALANMLFALCVFVVSIICIVQACSGNRWSVPFLGNFVSKVPS